MHTANLMASGGIAGPEFPKSGPMDEEPVAEPPMTRQSQIIEEDMEEDVEEVDTFGGPGDHAVLQDSQLSPVEIVKPADDAMVVVPAGESSEQDHKPVLAPPPDLDSSPIRLPHSSSLRASWPEVEASDLTEPDVKGKANASDFS